MQKVTNALAALDGCFKRVNEIKRDDFRFRWGEIAAICGFFTAAMVAQNYGLFGDKQMFALLGSAIMMVGRLTVTGLRRSIGTVHDLPDKIRDRNIEVQELQVKDMTMQAELMGHRATADLIRVKQQLLPNRMIVDEESSLSHR